VYEILSSHAPGEVYIGERESQIEDKKVLYLTLMYIFEL
jgi:hypothetical protein